MRQTLRHESLIQDDRSVGEACVDVAIGPLGGSLAHRQLAGLDGRKVLRSPFHAPKLDAGGDHVAVRTRIGPTWVQAFERVYRERQLLELDPDLLDRIVRCRLVDSRDRQNRLADEFGLIREHRRGRLRRIGDLAGPEDSENAFHRLGRARVDINDATVRNRTREQATKHHALCADVFGVLCLARNLRADVRRREIPADQ